MVAMSVRRPSVHCPFYSHISKTIQNTTKKLVIAYVSGRRSCSLPAKSNPAAIRKSFDKVCMCVCVFIMVSSQ